MCLILVVMEMFEDKYLSLGYGVVMKLIFDSLHGYSVVTQGHTAESKSHQVFNLLSDVFIDVSHLTA